jgi:hypothetical protein
MSRSGKRSCPVARAAEQTKAATRPAANLIGHPFQECLTYTPLSESAKGQSGSRSH